MNEDKAKRILEEIGTIHRINPAILTLVVHGEIICSSLGFSYTDLLDELKAALRNAIRTIEGT